MRVNNWFLAWLRRWTVRSPWLAWPTLALCECVGMGVCVCVCVCAYIEICRELYEQLQVKSFFVMEKLWHFRPLGSLVGQLSTIVTCKCAKFWNFFVEKLLIYISYRWAVKIWGEKGRAFCVGKVASRWQSSVVRKDLSEKKKILKTVYNTNFTNYYKIIKIKTNFAYKF